MNKFLTAVVLSACMAATASAQDDGTLKSWSYLEVQGGIQLTSTDAPMNKLLTPTASFSFGHYFTPVVGARIGVNAWQAKSGFDDKVAAPFQGDVYYKWKYITPSIDLMLNLSNMFCKTNTDRFLNVILLGGVGLNYAWDNDELKNLNLSPLQTPMAWEDNRLSHNLRAALRLETKQSAPFGVSLEVAANSLDDRFNSKYSDKDDWQFTAQLGLMWRFGKGYKSCDCPKKAPEPAPVVERKPEPKPVAQPERKPEPKPVVTPQPVKPQTNKMAVVKNDKLHEAIFYKIRESDPEGNKALMQRVAQFLKKYPDAKVQVVGYADKGTGTSAMNKRYAQQRAQKAKQELVNDYGCDAKRIEVSSKGDTVQPYAENDKNRCVIIEGEAQYTVYE